MPFPPGSGERFLESFDLVALVFEEACTDLFEGAFSVAESEGVIRWDGVELAVGRSVICPSVSREAATCLTTVPTSTLSAVCSGEEAGLPADARSLRRPACFGPGHFGRVRGALRAKDRRPRSVGALERDAARGRAELGRRLAPEGELAFLEGAPPPGRRVPVAVREPPGGPPERPLDLGPFNPAMGIQAVGLGATRAS